MHFVYFQGNARYSMVGLWLSSPGGFILKYLHVKPAYLNLLVRCVFYCVSANMLSCSTVPFLLVFVFRRWKSQIGGQGIVIIAARKSYIWKGLALTLLLCWELVIIIQSSSSNTGVAQNVLETIYSSCCQNTGPIFSLSHLSCVTVNGAVEAEKVWAKV